MEAASSRIAQLSAPKEAVGYHEDRYCLILMMHHQSFIDWILGDRFIGIIIYQIKIIQLQQKSVIYRILRAVQVIGFHSDHTKN